jgi:nitrite reductase/ring-hydroxylating ferredoxin subunit
MERAGGEPGWRCEAATVPVGQSVGFDLERGTGPAARCFAVNHEDRFYAYVNRCPHAGHALDGRPNRFFTDDGRRLVCAVHGAVFDPSTGICLDGPCPGAGLERLAVEHQGDALVITWPS